MTWISTYPHDRWFAPQTVTLYVMSVCAPGEVLVCRIGRGPYPLCGGVPCVALVSLSSVWRPWDHRLLVDCQP